MAKVGDNIVTTGLSGKLGNLIVFRNHGGKTVVSTVSQKKRGEPSEAQEKQRLKFQEAILYGQSVIADKATKDSYQASAQDGKTAYNVAVADFLNAPSINEIDVSHYTGQPGSYIQIRAIDDFLVKEVSVAIHNGDGTEVESGMALPQPGTIWWRYTATDKSTSLAGSKIVVRVTDLPGNLTQQTAQI